MRLLLMRMDLQTTTLEDLGAAEAFGESFGLRAWWLEEDSVAQPIEGEAQEQGSDKKYDSADG